MALSAPLGLLISIFRRQGLTLRPVRTHLSGTVGALMIQKSHQSQMVQAVGPIQTPLRVNEQLVVGLRIPTT